MLAPFVWVRDWFEGDKASFRYCQWVPIRSLYPACILAICSVYLFHGLVSLHRGHIPVVNVSTKPVGSMGSIAENPANGLYTLLTVAGKAG